MNNKRHGLRAETALRDTLQSRGYVCIRSAASKVVDLVCVRPSPYPVYLLEVKATSGDVIRVSRTANQREQQAELQRLWAETWTAVLYAVRFGDGHYEFFTPLINIMRQGEGVPLDDVFPPINPPIVPPSEE